MSNTEVPTKLYSFDDYPEHKEQLEPWSKKWIANALRTEPMTENDRQIMRKAIVDMHGVINIPPPQNIVFADGPVTAGIAAALAAGVWEVRQPENAERPAFTGKCTEYELRTAVERTIELVWPKDEFVRDITLKLVTAAIADTNYDALAVPAEVDDTKIKAVVVYLTSALSNWAQLRNGGNQWSGWTSYITFFRYVAKLPLDYTAWDPYEKAAVHGGPRFMHARFCIVSDMPMYIHRDRDGRPHCMDGPFTAWRDGIKIYRVRGVEVPPEWVEKRSELDPKMALTWANIEQRRVLVELVGGWNRVISTMSLRVIDEDADPQIGTLMEGDVPGSGMERFLKVRCGTGRDFVLMVSRECKTAREANARTFRLKPEELNIEVRT